MILRNKIKTSCPVTFNLSINYNDVADKIRVLCWFAPNLTNNETVWVYNALGWFGLVRLMVFNATFNNISVISRRSVLLTEETRLPGESYWQTSSHNDVSRTHRHELGSNSQLNGDRHWLHSSCKSNYHTITTAPWCIWFIWLQIYFGSTTIL